MSVSHDARPARSSVFDDELYSSLEPNQLGSLLLYQHKCYYTTEVARFSLHRPIYRSFVSNFCVLCVVVYAAKTWYSTYVRC